MSDPIAEAKAEILRLHRAWQEANAGLQGGKLRHIMAGESFFNYNLNGYRYDGLSEIEKLWEPEHMPSAFELIELRNERHLNIEATPDMGWLTVEADCELRMKTPGGSGDMRGDGEVVVMPYRITELFRRDDGRGNPVWRMWHFHASKELVDGGKRFITE
jgi:hypothetical protein